METLDEAKYKVEPEPYGDFVATPAGVRASLDDPERKENPARLSVTVVVVARMCHALSRAAYAELCRYCENASPSDRQANKQEAIA